MFVGEELDAVLQAIKRGEEYSGVCAVAMNIGVDSLPHFSKDTTDRNRTSPFAFTGNKFEFRMPGSAVSISWPNIVLNTIVADALDAFAGLLEDAGNKGINQNDRIALIVKNTMAKHERIIFNGNNYAPEWVDEAAKRGLLNLTGAVDAIPLMSTPENVALFERHGVFSKSEVDSRVELSLENYYKTLHFEALTLIDMVHRDVDPAVIAYESEVSKLAANLKELDIDNANEVGLLKKLLSLGGASAKALALLEDAVVAADKHDEALTIAKHYREVVFPAMQSLRSVVDELEMVVAAKYWPYPSYGQILYGVR
jgi:glutamine synthetase